MKAALQRRKLAPGLTAAALLALAGGLLPGQAPPGAAGQRPPQDAELVGALKAAQSRGQEPERSLQQTAFDRARELIAAGRYGEARELQAALHAAVGADWSALDLSLTEIRLSRLDAAEALLLEQLRRSSAPAELWNQLGLLALAQERPEQAASAWARALRLGSENAGLSLARLRLQQGRIDAALALFRQGVDREPPPAWSLAGWALCLLGPEPGGAPAAGPEPGG